MLKLTEIRKKSKFPAAMPAVYNYFFAAAYREDKTPGCLIASGSFLYTRSSRKGLAWIPANVDKACAV
jgi:hypothetical protein